MPGKSHGLRSLLGFSPWGCKESDTTEQLHFTSLSMQSFLEGEPEILLLGVYYINIIIKYVKIGIRMFITEVFIAKKKKEII